MAKEYNKDLFSRVPYEDPKFFSSIFTAIASSCDTQEEFCVFFDLLKEAEVSFWMDETKVQDSFEFRAKRRALLVGEYIVGEKGEIDLSRVSLVLSLLEKQGFITYPDGFSDGVITTHIVSVLKKLWEDKDFARMIAKFQTPLCHSWAEDLVRESLGLVKNTPLTDRHVRLAVVSACLTVLRQNVGSCFATAPAILIQKEQIEYLVKDLYDLLSSGKLKRTFGGVESSAPLSPSSGVGDLYRTIGSVEGVLNSPGLLSAWKGAGIENPEPLILQCIEKASEKQEELRIDDLIHQVLLSQYQLEENDLLVYRKKQKLLARQAGILGDKGDRAGFVKMQACDAMLDGEQKAKAAFKSLTHHALLKAWEFTLASFSEGKMEFSQWNLYASLGLDHEELGGVGDVLYRALDGKLQENNAKVEEYQADYSLAYDQLQATERLLQQASTEAEIRRLKAEFNTRLYHMQSCQARRDECHRISSVYVHFFSFLITQYKELFPEYFQEIYDADMRDVKSGPYEDSPAGFRLVYKHGRTNASLWTMIYTAEEYIDALADFFDTTEARIGAAHDWEEAPSVIADLTTAVITHVRTEEFLASAMRRMAKVHGKATVKDPLQAIEKQEKKPWSYTSGGSMKALLQMYYKQENVLTEEKKWLENETHLCTFILDTLKNLPQVELDKGFLMNSPTHAFILYPSWEEVMKGWQEPIFTYSWVRDQVVLPKKQFYEKIVLSLEQQQFLWKEFLKQLPPILVKKVEGVSFADKQSVVHFRAQIMEVFRGRISDRVDSFLYGNLPLVAGPLWKEKVVQVLSPLVPNLATAGVLDLFPDIPSSFITARNIRALATVVYLAATGSVASSFDVHQKIAEQSLFLQLAPPFPFLFADTNWTNYYFGLLVNPGTGELELWRVEKTGLSGFPMISWKKSFDGADPKEWSIFSKPIEYR